MNYSELAIELGVLLIFGLLYYFWQKRRILQFEENKIIAVSTPLLSACLYEQELKSFTELDNFILSLDDFIKGSQLNFPLEQAIALRDHLMCPEDLKAILIESLRELGHD